MRFRGTVILLAVFVVLGVYVYFTEYRGKEERQQQQAAEKKVVHFEPKDVGEITLKHDNTTITAVRKGEKQWQITNPPGIEADSDEWERLAQSISDIQREDSIPASTADLANFGLDKPPVEIAVKLAAGRTTTIQFGSENPRKTLNYLKISDSNDVLLSPSKADAFKKTLTDLRNKKVVEVEATVIDSVKFQDITLQKSGEDWNLKTPLAAKADPSEVSMLLSTVQFSRATGFAEDSVDLKQAGLAPPAVQLTMHDGKANADRVLMFGKEAESGKYYAKDAARPMIFIVDSQIIDKLRRPVFDWRDKSIVQLNRDKIQEIEIARGPDKFSFKKVEADWKLPDGRKLQWDKVSSMLNTLEFEKAKDIIDSPKALSTYGLDAPKLQIAFKQGDSSPLQVAVGGNSKTPEGVYLKTSSNAAVMVVSMDVYDKFNVKVDDLVEAKPAAANSK